MLKQRNQALKDAMGRLPRGAENATYLKYPGFQETEGKPMTIRRAAAFRSLLAGYEKILYPQDLIAGSLNGLAAAVKDSEFDEKVRYVQSFSERSFLTNADHAAPNYEKLLRVGVGGLLQEVEQSIKHHGDDGEKLAFLQSVKIALEGFADFIRGYQKAAADDGSEALKALCKIDSAPPESFRQALQLVWLCHLAFFLEGRSAMAFGRLDQYLYPFYAADKAAGRLTDEEATCLLEQMFLRIGEKRYVFGGDDVCNICAGGVKPDGTDGTNELTYLIIDAVENCQIPGPNLTVRVHKNTSQRLYKRCLTCLATGIGYPSMMNDEINIPALLRRGYALSDARNYCFVGCIEIFLAGKQPPWTDGRFDTPKYLELALNDGVCMLTGRQMGPKTGDAESFSSFDDFFAAYQKQLEFGIEATMQGFYSYNTISRPADFTSPFLSALTDDCILRGRDVNDGGAHYPSNFGIGVMGIGTVADSLAAVENLVFREKRLTMAELVCALKANFEGFEWVRELLLAAPKYGNDDDAADKFAVWFLDYFKRQFDRYATRDGGFVWIAVAGNINNVTSGAVTAATPDGRLARSPISDAASPSYGADAKGPTAVMNSVAKPDYTKSETGSVLNQKYSPAMLSGEQNLCNMAALVQTYFELGGQELQVNIVDDETLKDAMAHPENYPNLMVRVSGFSARFVELAKEVQLDIIARTEHVG